MLQSALQRSYIILTTYTHRYRHTYIIYTYIPCCRARCSIHQLRDIHNIYTFLHIIYINTYKRTYICTYVGRCNVRQLRV